MYVNPALSVSFGEDTKSSPMFVQIMFYVIVSLHGLFAECGIPDCTAVIVPLVCSLSVVCT